jgi:beta-galactosidase
LQIKGADFAIGFDKLTGDLSSYRYVNTELFKHAAAPNFWRALTDNDRGSKLQERCGTWRDAGALRSLHSFTWETSSSQVNVRVQYILPTVSQSWCTINYTILPDGMIKLRQELVPGEHLPEIPEIGLLFQLDQSFENLTWYGRGAHENYWDRSVSARIGLYTGKVSEQYVPYLRPQECGNKTDVRYARLMNGHGIGLEFFGSSLFELNALPYTPHELEQYDHGYKLPISDRVALRINHKQMGVGGDDSWGARTHPEFTLYANRTYSFEFQFRGAKE